MSLLLAAVSCLQEERSPDEILIPSPAQVKCEESSFTLNSTVPKGTEDIVYSCGFYVSKDQSLSDPVKVNATISSNTFEADLPSREYGTRYYLCSFVTNGDELEFKSDVTTFDLQPLESYFEFGEVKIVDYDKVSREVEIAVDADIYSGVGITEIGVCYGEGPDGLSVEGDHKAGVFASEVRSEAGVVTVVLDGFADATQYYIKPYIKDGDYIAYGDVMPFYIPAVANVSTFDAADVTASGAVLSGEVTDECGSAVTERGFVWEEGDVMPTIDSDKMTAGSGMGVMSATVTGLAPNQKYTFRAYAVNASGTAYGESRTFTTLVALPVLATSTITDITSTTATFTGVVSSDGGEDVSEVGFYYGTDKGVDPSASQKVSIKYSAYHKSAKGLASNTLFSAMQETASQASEGEEFSIEVDNLALKTRYYVRSYAVNSAGTAYGETVDFETLAEKASILTVGSSDVTTTSAVLSGNITADNGERITERGFVWMEGTGKPTTDSNKLKVSGTVGEFNATLKGLSPNRKYSFCAYAVNAEGTSYGEVKTFTTAVALPVLSEVIVSSITSTSVKLSGIVADHGGETVTEVGFYYSTEADVNPETSKKVSQIYADDSFTIDVEELEIFTRYYVRAYAKNSAGIAVSEVKDFMTASSSPSVQTVGASDITMESATLAGKVISDNGEDVTERGFVWLRGEDVPTMDSYILRVSGTADDFTATLSGLEPNARYSFRAYAINAKGTSLGETKTFSTVAGLPVISAISVTDITSTTASFSGVIADHNGANISEVGFYYSTSEQVDPTSSVKVVQAYSKDSFSASVSGLSVNTRYYVKAFATNSAGTAYSDVASFNTLSSVPTVITLGASDVTSTSALLSGNVVTDNGATVTERGFVWVIGDDTPTISSHKIKVDGTLGDFSTLLDNLDPNKKYSFRAYALNSEGTSYGEIVTFTTIAGLPSLTSVDVASITSTGATFSSSVIGHGGSTVTDVGFYYSTSASVDPETSSKVSQKYAKDAFSLSVNDLSIYTEYYVRAFATNAAGTAYSPVVRFTTAASAPVVRTLSSSDVKAKSANLSGTVVTDNGSAITERGFTWLKGEGNPSATSERLKVSGTTGEFSSTLSGLEPVQTYSFRAYAVNAKGTTYGEVMTFTTIPDVMTLTTGQASSVTASSASVSGSITYYGGNDVTEVGVCWSTGQNPTVSDSHKAASSVTKDFTVNLSGLNEHTTYYARAYATAKTGVTYYGDAVSFATLYKVITPSASKTTVSGITVSSASLASSVTSDGHGTITDAGFVYSTTSGPTVSGSKKSCGAKTGEFSAQITGLKDGTKYYVRSYVTNESGTGYGEEVSFTTTAISVPTLSSVTLGTVTYESASFTAKVTALNNGTLADAGFVYSTSQTPDLNSSKISCGKVADLSGKAVSLKASTIYYVRAYATNEKGTSYSAQASFTTGAAPSIPSVTTGSASSVTSSGASVSGNVTNLGIESGVTQHGHVWSTSSNLSLSSGSKSELGSRTSTGSFTSKLTGLKPNVTYYVKAYATNSEGTAYGDAITFTTEADAMTLTTGQASSVTASSASVSGSITYYGGNDVTEVGVCWSTGQSPTVSDSHKAASSVAKDFTVSLSGLNEHTTYYARAYATAKTGVTYYGPSVSFTTLYKVIAPSASKTTVSGITVSSANLVASVTSDGHGTITDAGFVYSTTSGPTVSGSKKSCGAKTGEFSAQITGLKDGTKYYVRSYVTNESGTGYGEEVSFTTTAITVPTVSAVTMGTVTYNSASFTAEVTALNNGTLTEVGFVYSTSQNPGLNSNKISCGKSASISGKAISLEAVTTYYVRAFATNEKGTAYGPEISFTTKEAPEQSDIDADDFKPETDWD